MKERKGDGLDQKRLAAVELITTAVRLLTGAPEGGERRSSHSHRCMGSELISKGCYNYTCTAMAVLMVA